MAFTEILLTEPESFDLLIPYGIPLLPFGVAQSASEAVELAGRWPEPLVLKIVSRDIQHKSDVGGVQLAVPREEVALAYEELIKTVTRQAPGCEIEGVLVQPQARSGIEVIIGAKLDPAFGYVALLGAGGILSEVLDEVSLRLLPMETSVAREMVTETKLAKILRGSRGNPPADIDALCDIMVRISHLLADHPGIIELDLNPVLVHTDGATAVDALVKLSRPDGKSQKRSGA